MPENIPASAFFVTDFRWKIRNIMHKNLSINGVRSTSTGKLRNIIDVYMQPCDVSFFVPYVSMHRQTILTLLGQDDE